MSNDPPRGRGRPPEGERVEVRLPAELLADIDWWRAGRGLTRSAAIRELLRDAFGNR
jgi:metal-responsive CopG/Arc/MetJ family transcriptional regulator